MEESIKCFSYSVSVAMATYNGERFLSQQLDSILVQLADSDELIISDDGSTDSTLRIIREYQKKYKQIVLIDGPQKGYVFNFENAIKNCKNELIFLSDQDDIWCFDKISIVKQLFNKNEKQLLLMHNAKLIDKKGKLLNKTLFEIRPPKKGYARNILSSYYFGCCMVFKKELKQYILPFPKTVPTHDQWISNIAEKLKLTFSSQETLIMYRKHDNNKSTKLTFCNKIRFRIYMLKSLYKQNKKYGGI